MQTLSFLNIITLFFNSYFVAVHKLSDCMWEEIFRCDRSYVCTAPLILSWLVNLNPRKASFSGPNIWQAYWVMSRLCIWCGGSSNFSFLNASTAAAADWKRTLSWNKRTSWTGNLCACCKALKISHKF